MFVALLLSFVLVHFVFLIVGPPVGYFVFVLASPIPVDGFLSNLFPAYIGGIIPAFLAGLANWVLLIALYSRISRLRFNLLSMVVSGVAAPMTIGWQLAVEETIGLLLLFLLVCFVATVVCVFLANKPALNILEDLRVPSENP